MGIDGASTPDIYVSGEDEGPSTYGNSTTTVVGQNSSKAQAYVIEVLSGTGGFISGLGATGSGSGTSDADSLAVNSNGLGAAIGTYTAPTTLGTVPLSSGSQVFIANLTGTPPTPLTFDLAIRMTDSSTTYTPGGSTTYTIVVSNKGPSAVTGAGVSDSFGSGIISETWTAVASTGASPTNSSGTGAITQTVSLQAGATVTFTVVAQISSSATSTLFSAAVVTTTAVTPVGVTDSNSASVTLAATQSPPPPTPPVFVGEQRVYSGKGKHQKLVGFKFLFNGGLNAGAAQSIGDYYVVQKAGKKLKVLPVKSALYNPSSSSVTISVGGFKTGKAAQVTIAGLVGANGAAIAQIVSRL